MQNKDDGILKRIDPFTTVAPFLAILTLCAFFVIKPKQSTNALSMIREFLGDKFGVYYLFVALAIFLTSFYCAFSKIGGITLGKEGEKPKYGFFKWGSMVFTCGLAADILFYSMCEWIMYAQESRVKELGSMQEWAPTMPLFHWGPTVWSFYATLAACFGFMLHVRKRHKQKYSEACRPILGKYTDKLPGKLVDILAVVALIAGTATTFSVATPLLSLALSNLFGINDSKWLTIGILVTICLIYTFAVLKGIKGVSWLADACMYIFAGFLLYVLLFGGEAKYIVETGFSSIGNMVQNFVSLSTWTDPLRKTSFPQNYTMYYWAYWLVWCVASPFFMGSISRGRTVKQVIIGAYGFGLSSTFVSFIILGDYGLGLQVKGKFDAIKYINDSGNLYTTVIEIIKTLPLYQIALILLVVAMVTFYATSFDSITLVASSYSYLELAEREVASKKMKLFWSILLIMLPIALIFSEGSMNNMQTVSIIAAFPIAMVIMLIIISFIKDANNYIKEKN